MAIINESNRKAITDLVVELREQGVKWDTEDGIRAQVAAKFPVYTSKSAIPLRKLYHAAKAESGMKFNATTAKGKKTLVDMREGRHPSCDNYRGAGWAQLSQLTGLTEGALKKLYEEAGGEYPTTGRLYVSSDGTVNHVAESTVAIHKARQAPVETTEETTPEPVAEQQAAEAPKSKRVPRSRNRKNTAAA